MSHTEFKNSAIAKQQSKQSVREGVVMIAFSLVILAAVLAAFANATN